MTKIILSGCNGKMGRVISDIVSKDAECEIVAGLDINDYLKNDYPVFTDISECDIKADVIIDFSHPSVLDGLLDYAVKTNTPLVIATTGLSDEQKQKMQQASEKIAVFFSANFSIGINLLINLAKKAAILLEKDFDIEIIEKHHNQKIDAPSGTALAIADGINDVLENKCEYVYDRHSKRVKRTKSEIGIHAVRGGTIVGEHEVIYAGNNEDISLSNSAQSKAVIAAGAVRAAKFLKDKFPGMYSMKELVDSVN